MIRVALMAGGWLSGWWLLARIPRPAAEAGAGVPSLEGVTVVVPARNEATNLPRLLGSLPVGLDVVVVDDQSDDGTADVARAAGVRVVAAPDLPDGWTGKSWACWTGATETTGRILVFLDADIWFEAGGFERVLTEQRRHGGLLSVQPFHVTSRPYEVLSAFFNVVGMMGISCFTPLRRPPTGAFGPTLVCERSQYDEAGGHQAVRGEILDDVALARRFRSVTCLGGRGTVNFRMYSGGFGQLVEGWTKNMAAGAGAAPVATAGLIFLWVTAALVAVTGWWAFAAFAVQFVVHLRRVGRFSWWAPFVYPLLLAFFVALFVRSVAFTVVRRRVTWRGREVRL